MKGALSGVSLHVRHACAPATWAAIQPARVAVWVGRVRLGVGGKRGNRARVGGVSSGVGWALTEGEWLDKGSG